MRDETPRKILQKLTSPAVRSPAMSPPVNSREQKPETQGIIKGFLQPTPHKSANQIHSLHQAILDHPLFKDCGASIDNHVLTLKSFSTPQKAVLKPNTAEPQKPPSLKAPPTSAESPPNPTTPLQAHFPPPIVQRILSPSIVSTTPTTHQQSSTSTPLPSILSPSQLKFQTPAPNLALIGFPDAVVKRATSKRSLLPYKRDYVTTILEILNYLVFFAILTTLGLLLYLIFITSDWHAVVNRQWVKLDWEDFNEWRRYMILTSAQWNSALKRNWVQMDWKGDVDEWRKWGKLAFISLEAQFKSLAQYTQQVMRNGNPTVQELMRSTVLLWKRIDRDMTSWVTVAFAQLRALLRI
eukprot:gene24881-30061_t